MESGTKLHSVAVVAVIKNSEDRYLVLKRHEGELVYPGMYTFPGGKIEGNETTEEALVREVLEEAGLIMKPGKILLKDKSVIRPDGQTAKYFSYMCEVEDDSVVALSKDFTDYKWVTVEELAALPHVGLEEELRKAEQIISSGIDLTILKTLSVKADLAT